MASSGDAPPAAGEKRVLIISQVPPPVHGSTVMTSTLIQALLSEGYTPQLVDRRFSRSVDEVGRFQIRKIGAALSLVARVLHAAVRAAGVPCIFFLTNRPFSLVVDAAISVILRICRVRVIGYVHTSGYREVSSRSRLLAWCLKLSLRPLVACVVLGESLAADIAALSPALIRVIPNACARPNRPSGGGSAPLTVLFLSNLLPDKGVEEFLALAFELAPRHPATRFVIAGTPVDGDQVVRLRQRISSVGLADRIEVIGGVSGDKKWDLLEKSTLLVFPSRYRLEAQPLTIIEAFAAGLPVVATDVGGVGDLVRNDEVGLMVPSGDQAALERAVEVLLSDSQALQQMSSKARELYEVKYSPTVYARAWRELLLEVGHGG